LIAKPVGLVFERFRLPRLLSWSFGIGVASFFWAFAASASLVALAVEFALRASSMFWIASGKCEQAKG